MSKAAENPCILYINLEMQAGGSTVHRDEFVRAARDLGANITVHFHSRTVGLGNGRESLWQKLKGWFYNKRTEIALFAMVVKHLPSQARTLLRVHPQVLLIRYTIDFPIVLLARILRIPVVLEINAPYYLHASYAGERLHLQGFWRFMERQAIRFSDAAIVVSHLLLDHYVSLGFPPEKFTAVPNGVDLSEFRPDICGDYIRQRYGVEDSVVVGFVGKLQPWGGIDRFLENIPRLGSLLDNVMVLILGSGPLEPRLREIVSEHGLEQHVQFTGFVPHECIPEHIAAFDIAVAPYRKVELFYGSPMKVHEYLAMGKPVVTPRMGQSEELIQHGTNGLLYEPDNDDELVELVRLLIQDADLRARLGQAASASSRQQAWTWKRNAEAILAICRNAAVRST